MGRKKGVSKKESVKLSGRFSKYAAVMMFLNYHYCYRAAIPVKHVRSPRHRDNNNRARLWIANLARLSAALERAVTKRTTRRTRIRDAWRTFASPTNESTKYRPYTLALLRLVIIKRYKREADCARLIASLWRTNACETRETLRSCAEE